MVEIVRNAWADSGKSRSRGFTILEVLVATTILALLLVLVLSVISQSSNIWRRSMDKIESSQGARLAFESITRNLSQATLNTYLDYDDPANPQQYLRKSELKFFSDAAGTGTLPGTAKTGSVFFFQAPVGYTTNTSYIGMDSLLNTCGYFVSYTTNSGVPSHVSNAGNVYRYRLMQVLVPAESNTIYQTNLGPTAWFDAFAGVARPVADNIIAVVVRPQDPGSAAADLPNNQYAYDSTLNATNSPQPVTAHQLPPVVQVTMVAIDETSAERIDSGSSQPTEISTALDGKFLNPANYQSDLDALVASLSAKNVNYRIFSSAVPIRESKWSK